MNQGSTPLSALCQRIHARNYKVAIVGMGYVGLPLGLAFVREGFSVLGIDKDPAKVEMLGRCQSYLRHIQMDILKEATKTGQFEATADFDRLKDADAVLLCVPTPVDEHQEPDMRFVRDTAEAVGARLKAGQLVVLESTTYPGTTDELIRGILSRSELAAGERYYLAYSPEREDPGNAEFGTSTIPKLVGGIDEDSGLLAETLYKEVISQVVRVRNARIAEAAKLTENIFRAVNIALVNELKVTFDHMGLDVWEVLDAAATKPFGFMRFNPGPGWGGHCIPVDPFYLSWKAREYGAAPKFIELAGEINIQMHDYVVGKLMRGLNTQKKAVSGSRVLLLGIAYKKDIDDCRESPAFPIMLQLRQLGADVVFHDPFVEEIPALRDWPAFKGQKTLPLTADVVQSADAVLVVTDHGAVDYDLVRTHARLIVDTRGIFRETASHVIKA